MSLSTQPPPAPLTPAVTPRLKTVLQAITALAVLGFAYLGLGLLDGTFDPVVAYPMAGYGFTALAAAAGMWLKTRRPDAPAPVRWAERWLLYAGAIVLLLPLAMIAGGSLLFCFYTVRMVYAPNYIPSGPMYAPVIELLLSAAALAGLVWLLAYALHVIHRDY